MPEFRDNETERNRARKLNELDATVADKSDATQGVAVANAAGANPTQAEFNALLTSLRNAGVIAT